jgi:hypothetical protein
MICGNGFNLQLAAGTLVFFAQQAHNSEVSRVEQQHARRFWRVAHILVIEMNLGAPRAGDRTGRFLFYLDITSAPGEIRTPDLLVRSLFRSRCN